MAGSPSAQRCPHCGEQPMSRLRYAFLPGTRSKCRRCGRRIRLDVTRVQVLALVLFGVAFGAVLTSWVDSAPALIAALAVAVLIAVTIEVWAWHSLAWGPDTKPDDAREREPERAG